MLKERYESKRDAIAIDHTKWIALYVHKNMNIIFWGQIIYLKFLDHLPSVKQSKGHQYVTIMFIDLYRCNLLFKRYTSYIYIYDISIYDIYIYIHVALLLLSSSSPFASIYNPNCEHPSQLNRLLRHYPLQNPEGSRGFLKFGSWSACLMNPYESHGLCNSPDHCLSDRIYVPICLYALPVSVCS